METSENKNVRAQGVWDIAIRLLLTLGLLYCVYLVAAHTTALWYFRQPAPDSLHKAIAWDPGNAMFYSALGRVLQESPEEAEPEEVLLLFQKATQLNPQHARNWAELGGAYEWAGKNEESLRAFERARDLFPNSPRINWHLSNFYLREGKSVAALQALQKVLLGDPDLRAQTFDLAWRATNDARLILETMIPPDAEIIFLYLDYLIQQKRIAEAEQVWAHLLTLDLRFKTQAAFPYINALIQHQRLDELTAAWSALADRAPTLIRRQPFDANVIMNGSFEHPILNGGLGWQVKPVEGVIVSVNSLAFFDGAHSLRLEFDGKHNLTYRHLYQYVPVKPNTLYRFAGYGRAQRITTDSGLRFQLRDAYDPTILNLTTDNIVGTSTWLPQKLQFQTGPDTRLLLIRVIRTPSRKIDNKIAGTFWADNIELTAVE